MRAGAARVGVRCLCAQILPGRLRKNPQGGAQPVQAAKFSFHSWVASAGGASGLKKAES